MSISSLSKCSFSIDMDYNSQADISHYYFKVMCEKPIRQNSDLTLSLPKEYIGQYLNLQAT